MPETRNRVEAEPGRRDVGEVSAPRVTTAGDDALLVCAARSSPLVACGCDVSQHQLSSPWIIRSMPSSSLRPRAIRVASCFESTLPMDASWVTWARG